MTASVTQGEPNSFRVRHTDSQALAVSGVVKASGGVFYEINGYNGSASTRYVHIYNSATVPADTAIPACVPITVPPFGVFSLSFEHGFQCGAGISWASSTTLQTKTVSGTPDVWTTITYR